MPLAWEKLPFAGIVDPVRSGRAAKWFRPVNVGKRQNIMADRATASDFAKIASCAELPLPMRRDGHANLQRRWMTAVSPKQSLGDGVMQRVFMAI